ncbi:aldehyde dehydrogenase family protein [Streptomyces sp. BRA346]|uniref:aldehyde dehydrogenase family protein n=1 Tax=Streptomyces sp. BRA346 TaxID=2878199 RepID=UPI00406445EB
MTKTHDFLDRQGPGKVFGPALAVIPYGWEEEAITIANSSKYGLGRNGVDGRPRSR